MKTLVTGATGFLGTHLMEELCRREDPRTIRVLVRDGRGSASQSSWTSKGIEVASGSVTVASEVARALEGVSHVYHLAGAVSRRSEDAHRMYAVHVDGTRILCEAARARGVQRVLVVSTSGTVAVSETPDDKIDEDSPAPMELIARWPYYASKLYQEEAARRACGEDLELVIVNPSLLLGPGDDRLSSTRDVLSFLARDIPMIPPGGLNFVDARDVAAVLPVAMKRGGAGERYLLGGYNSTFAEFFGRLERLTKVSGPVLKARGRWPLYAARAQAALLRQFGRTPRVDPVSVEMAQYHWYFDSGKAIRALGFSVREASETLFDTVGYLRRHFLGNGALAGRNGDLEGDNRENQTSPILRSPS